jgi:YVTN family beta-propeller protein
VYVPNSDEATVDVIDPVSHKVVMHFPVGAVPHHITPSWDLRQLYVDNTSANTLTSIDPHSGLPVATLRIADPYNLYFIPDGSAAIVIAERLSRLDFYDRSTWSALVSVPIPWSGVDHLDFSADGRYLVASAEFSGAVVKVDLVGRAVSGYAQVGGLPVDVRLAPDGSVFFIANQGRHGVSVFDADRMEEVAFIPTGRGAHGLLLSRDANRLFVSNRLAGTISVIDLSTRQVAATWTVGGSPDMMQVSPDGRELWVSNRFHSSVSVIDTATGAVLDRIPVGTGPHGLTYFPQPGILSIGHNGIYR